MNHRLKTLGLVLIGMLSLSGIAAGAAHAETPIASELAAPNVTTLDINDVTGTEDGKLARLTIGSGARFIECAAAKQASGSFTGSATTVTATPTYEKCFSNGLTTIPVTVTHNGCTYTATATRVNAETKVLAHVTLDCPASKQLEIHVYKNATAHQNNEALCTYDIKPQTLTGADITSAGAGGSRDLTINLSTLSKLKLTNTGPSGLATCGIAVNAEGTAALTGKLTVTGTSASGAQVGVFLS